MFMAIVTSLEIIWHAIFSSGNTNHNKTSISLGHFKSKPGKKLATILDLKFYQKPCLYVETQGQSSDEIFRNGIPGMYTEPI